MESIKDTVYVGVNDHGIDLFEGHYDVRECGMSYNSYAILDTNVAITDGVDGRFTEEWLENIASALGSRTPDYLIVHHMEPDHSASIAAFMDLYPKATIVASTMAFKMMGNYFGTEYAERRRVVKDGETLELGVHTLTFIAAQNVHWPEVLFSYDANSKTLFSADAFGVFGARDCAASKGGAAARQVDEWVTWARPYYFGIVGKFGKNVQAALAKIADLDIERICSLHGTDLTEDLAAVISLYSTWASYEPEESGVCIAYASVYGHTKAAVEELACALQEHGVAVVLHDLAREDGSRVLADAFRFDRLVLASITYSGGIFPCMESFLSSLASHKFQRRRVALIENGTWGPAAARGMANHLAELDDVTILEPTLTIKGALNEGSRAQLAALVQALVAVM